MFIIFLRGIILLHGPRFLSVAGKNCYPYSMVRKGYSSRVTSKGQVTVPQEIRERLGLKAGDRLEFLAENGRTIIRRARVSANPFAKYAGVLGTFRRGKQEINAWLRDLRDEGPYRK
jgi:antitoxin PrlF